MSCFSFKEKKRKKWRSKEYEIVYPLFDNTKVNLHLVNDEFDYMNRKINGRTSF